MDIFDEIGDPFLNIYELFCYYKQKFFSNVLDSVSVEWSSKMTLFDKKTKNKSKQNRQMETKESNL